MTELHDEASIATTAARIERWLEGFDAAGRIEGEGLRWYIRLRGDDKDITTVWLILDQRTLRYETYVIPAPEENAVALYEQLLRRNEKLVGAHFSIGVEDAVFLRGEMATSAVTEPELDRAIGTLFATVEQCFQALLRVGFASHFR